MEKEREGGRESKREKESERMGRRGKIPKRQGEIEQSRYGNT